MAGFNRRFLQRQDNADTHLVYHVNKSLGVLPGEMFEHFELIAIREDRRYQFDALMWRKGGVDESFPGGRVTRYENVVKPTNK